MIGHYDAYLRFREIGMSHRRARNQVARMFRMTPRTVGRSIKREQQRIKLSTPKPSSPSKLYVPFRRPR